MIMHKTYTCPMHPEVKSGAPGKCSKCRMALVPKDKVHQTEDRGLRVLTWRNYLPLIVIISLITLASLASCWSVFRLISGSLSFRFMLQLFITYFMIGFFLVFAGFKLLDLPGFVEGYSTYDLLAQRWFGYGYIYPFIELAFGLLMLGSFHSAPLLWTEFIVMAFSGLGVAIKLWKREEFMCACLGTFLKVPLTYVTLVEDFGMAALALVLIFLK